MKKIFFFLLLIPIVSTAQLKVLAEGPVFSEPEHGSARVLFLKNGNTAYIRVTTKDGVDVRLYDPQYKEIAVRTLEPGYGKLQSMKVHGIYDLEGAINVFVSEWEGKIPTLYHIRIDGQSGALLDMKEVATLNKVGAKESFAVSFGRVPLPDFLLRRDPNTDHFGLIRYNTLESDRTQRVELIQYGPGGKELNRSFLSSPEARYKYTQIIDFVVVGNATYALLYSYNTESSGGASNELLLATVKDGNVSYANLGKSISRRINDGILRYNPFTKNLIFVTAEVSSTEKSGWNATTTKYAVQFSVIDPANPGLRQPVDFRGSSLRTKHRKVFKDDDNGFAPMPQQLYINPDGSFTLVLEEVTQIWRKSNGSSMPYKAGFELGSTAIITYNEDGTERFSALIPKRQTSVPNVFDRNNDNYAEATSFYVANRDNGAGVLSGGNQFKSFAYLNGKANSYVLLNDVEEYRSGSGRAS